MDQPVSPAARYQTIQVLLAEAEKSMDRQLDTIDGLDSKAGQLFQVVTLATTLLTFAMGLFLRSELMPGPPPCWFVLAALGVALVLYAVAWLCVIRAFDLRVYYLPLRMDREKIHSDYLALTSAEAQAQLLANYVKASDKNWTIIDEKATWVRRALYAAGVEIILLVAAIAGGVLLTQT